MLRHSRFNPFMPTAGVGIITTVRKAGDKRCFNPFMPTAGVGIGDVVVEIVVF